MVETTPPDTLAGVTTVQVLPELISFKVTSEKADGAYSMVETVTAPGGSVSPHLQHRDTERLGCVA